MALPSKLFIGLIAGCVLAAVTPRFAAAQHITVDGRFSPAQTLVGPNYAINANLGKQVGGNLFHSFGQFGLATGESASFSGPATIGNVIGRVTGGNPSSIDGRIQSTIARANLYLINPSGIVFGPNATVNVSGSFHASTADYLKLSEGARFQATNPDGSTLSAAPPVAFGFLTARPPAITVNGSTLGVAQGQTLGLIGGGTAASPTAINGAILTAPAGTIHVASVASTGEVPIDPRNKSALTVTSLGPVAVTGGSTLNVSDQVNLGSGGSVFIRSGALTINNASEINADNYGLGPGGKLLLRGDSQLALSNGAYVHSVAQADGSGAKVILRSAAGGTLSADNSGIVVGSIGAGNSGKLVLKGGQVSLTDGAGLISFAQSTGNGGAILIKANNLVIDGGATVTSTTMGAGLTDANGNPVPAGAGGAIAITAQNLTIQNGANVVAESFGDGTGGAIAITAGSVLADGGADPSTGIFSDTAGAGNGGSISIVAGNLALQNGANVLACASGVPLCTGAAPQGSAAGGDLSVAVGGSLTVDSAASVGTFAYAGGNAGNVAVSASGPITIDTSGAIGTETLGFGNAGNVLVNAGALAITNNGVIASGTLGAGNSGDISVDVFRTLSVTSPNGDPGAPTGILAQALPGSKGNAGNIFVTAGTLSITSRGEIGGGTFGSGNGGSVSVDVAGQLTLDNSGASADSQARIASQANLGSRGNAGDVTVTAGVLSIINNGVISSSTFGRGKGGNVSVTVDGQLTIEGAANIFATGIAADSGPGSTGNAGDVTVKAATISIVNGGEISSGAVGAVNNLPASTGNAGQVTVAAGSLFIASNGLIDSDTFGPGKGGNVSVKVDGQLTIDGAAAFRGSATGITADAGSTGSAGEVIVKAASLSLLDTGEISSATFGSGAGGSVSVDVAGVLSIDGRGNPMAPAGISTNSSPESTGNAGTIIVRAGNLSLANEGEIVSNAFGSGNAGTVDVIVANTLSIDGTGNAISVTGIGAETNVIGKGGDISISASNLSLVGGGEISSSTLGSGNAGTVAVTVAGALSIDGFGSTASTAPNRPTGIAAIAAQGSTGTGGDLIIKAGVLSIANGGLVSGNALGMGNGGSITVAAQSLTVSGGAQVATITAGSGNGGDVDVAVANDVTLSGTGPNGPSGITASALRGSSGDAGQVALKAGGAIALSGGAEVASSTAGAGKGGTVQVVAQGALSLSDPGSGIVALATPTAGGNAGSIMVQAPQITIAGGGEISSTTGGLGNGGSVMVTTPGALVLDGMGGRRTRIAASADPGARGEAGVLMVAAGNLTVQGGAQIASSTAGLGKGGDVAVTVTNGVSLSGAGPVGASGITTSAEPGSSGDAGQVVLKAGGAIALSGGAEVASSTAGVGKGGTVQVTGQGPLSLSDLGTGIVASATSTASGNAGSVMVMAPQITIASGAQIASTTGGLGNGGSVTVATPGALVLNGGGDPNTEIAASATGQESGPGGSVTVNSNTLTIGGGAQIASSTTGPGKGGNVRVTVAGDATLSGGTSLGSQISALSTGSGDAGSVTVSAVRLLMNNSAAISTEAETSKASGGNITLAVDDFLYLVSSKISTSVKGETGNGGNITIDPQFVVLNHSSIIAEAVEGHGGNITINAGQFIPSADSIVSASSQLGISGTVVISGPRVDVNGALVVLSTELRRAAEVLRHSCAAQVTQPQSSLVEGGRGGLPQDPDTTLPALYIAGRDVELNPQAASGTTEAKSTLQTKVHLTMHCG